MAEGSGEVAVATPSPANAQSNGTPGNATQSNNPLSRKLHKILETRLDNDKVDGRANQAQGPASCRAEPGGLQVGILLLLPIAFSPGRAPQARGINCFIDASENGVSKETLESDDFV